jgi:hypothetical protein
MQTIEGKWRDDLPDGPWNDEPDKVQWPDPTTGLACMIRRGPLGQWCGYVGVDETHPWFGKGPEDIRVIVHDGITYADACDGDEAQGICHVPGPGEPESLWWFGFACMTSWDLVPMMAESIADIQKRAPFPEMDDFPKMTYKDIAYVRAETTSLAHQVAAAR